MSKTFFYTATTLDGYIADENDSLDWLFVQQQDKDGPMNYDEFIKRIGAIAMGATTYQWILDHNARTGEKWAYDIPSWVFTHRTFEQPDADVRFTQDDVADVHAAMAEAAGGKDLWVVGGGDLAAQFAEAKLLDELILYIAPVTLGAGRPLFPRRFDLELTELAQNGAFMCARYAVVGPRDA
jgi:dihydrofolate reductase